MMEKFAPGNHPHKRYNPLTGEWVLVSPHRAKRPWLGAVEKPVPEKRPRYDPNCYLCPGNTRASGAENPAYKGTYVFDNDFAALLPGVDTGERDSEGLLIAKSERGICRVVCFSPRHDLTLPQMDQLNIRGIVDTWIEQYLDLGSKSFLNYVQIFENKGATMGCSNPHPHGQIWASETIPNEPAKEQRTQTAYLESRRSCLLCDYLELEIREGERVVCENEHFLALVPFWAVWPFETLLLSKRHVASLDQLVEAERDASASIIRRLTTRYDNLFETSFPYSMGFHQKPTDSREYPEWHLHAHFYPPLLRSATVKKFMVGYEMLGSTQRDITAETAAERLRSLPEVHYLYRSSS